MNKLILSLVLVSGLFGGNICKFMEKQVADSMVLKSNSSSKSMIYASNTNKLLEIYMKECPSRENIKLIKDKYQHMEDSTIYILDLASKL